MREGDGGDVAVATLNGRVRLFRYLVYSGSWRVDLIPNDLEDEHRYFNGDEPELLGWTEVEVTKPPGPDEPKKFGAVVETMDGKQWWRWTSSPEADRPWVRRGVRPSSITEVNWCDLDVRQIRQEHADVPW